MLPAVVALENAVTRPLTGAAAVCRVGKGDAMSDFEGYLRANDVLLDAVEGFVRRHGGNPFELPPLDMRLEPGLVRLGEKAVVRLSARGANPPAGRLTAAPDYLGGNPGPARELHIDWRKAGEAEWRAECSVAIDSPGNWRFEWLAGDWRLSRVLGVAAPGKVVITLWVGTNFPRLDREIHQYDLPGDHWVVSGFGLAPENIVAQLRPYAWDAFLFGDRLAPVCNAGDLFPGVKDKNLFKVSPAAQRQAIGQLQALWRKLGLKDLEIFACYTPGHATFGLLEELGFKALNSLCAWQNWLDGASSSDWQINHAGCPNSPYYPAPDDFRKVAAGPALVAFTMGTASSVRCYDIMCFDGCPTNCMGQIRYWRLPGVGANVHRFFAAVDGWIRDAGNNREPIFVTAGIENFYSCHESLKINVESIRYMVRRAGEGKVVFASAADIADFYRRHYALQPEHVHFQPDYMAGMRGWSKPARVPDRIEIVNSRFHSLHKDGENLPQFLWDHTVPWNNPEWSDQKELRDPFGLVTPETIAATINPEACVPRQADLRGVKAEVRVSPAPGGLRLAARVSSGSRINTLPIALWRIPLDAQAGIKVECQADNARWIPVRDGWSGNYNGILVLENVPAGDSEWHLRLSGAEKPAGAIDFTLSELLAGRTMRMREETRTYLWRATPDCRLKVNVRVPPGTPAAGMYLDGTKVIPDSDGCLELVLDERWAREAPSLVGAEPVQCGGEAIISIARVQPIRLTRHVQDWRASPALPLDGTFEALEYPRDINALRLAAHRIANDFAAINLDRLKGIKESAAVFLLARFQAFARTQVCADLGYDGPVKAWLDGRPLFDFPRGTSPREIEARPEFEAGPGEHEVLVAFGANEGIAWGIRLRLLSAGEETPLGHHVPESVVLPAARILQ